MPVFFYKAKPVFAAVLFLLLLAMMIPFKVQSSCFTADQGFEADTLQPDIIVAKDGSGKYTTISAALADISNGSTHRIIIYVRNGIYNEKVTVNRANVTIRGESRKGTRIEFSIPAGNESIARGVFNIFANGVILQNLTIANTYPHRRHTFALYGRGSFVLTQACDFIANGNDTVALWANGGGYYYHDDCHFEGNIDFLCPRGWCYVNNSTFYEVDTRAALWHDGDKDPSKKLVVKNSSFSGARKYALGRYPRDSQFYLIGCRFSDSTQNVRDDDAPEKPAADFHWGRRVFFFDCKQAGGNAPWLANNLHKATGSPNPAHITAQWTFGNAWNPERKDAPRIVKITVDKVYRTVDVWFAEPVTIRGNPLMTTTKGNTLAWTGINGTDKLTFAILAQGDQPSGFDLGSGSVFASQPTTQIRYANLMFNRNIIK